MSAVITVIGQGVIGLTTALRLAQAGHRVTALSKDAFASTESMAAGAYWWPFHAEPAERIHTWAAASYAVYRDLCADPRWGVWMHDHLRLSHEPEGFLSGLEIVDEWQAVDLDAGSGYRLRVPLIEVPLFMPRLLAQVRAAGVDCRQQQVQVFKELSGEAQVIVDCAGLGARELAGDEQLYPIRGQTVRVARPPDLVESWRLAQPHHIGLVLPRSQDVILGSTAQAGDWNHHASDTDTAAILARCRRLVPALTGPVLGTTVGLRPGRPEVRLEIDRTSARCPVIHNYGHGGSGYTTAWGCADEVAQLVRELM